MVPIDDSVFWNFENLIPKLISERCHASCFHRDSMIRKMYASKGYQYTSRPILAGCFRNFIILRKIHVKDYSAGRGRKKKGAYNPRVYARNGCVINLETEMLFLPGERGIYMDWKPASTVTLPLFLPSSAWSRGYIYTLMQRTNLSAHPYSVHIYTYTLSIYTHVHKCTKDSAHSAGYRCLASARASGL